MDRIKDKKFTEFYRLYLTAIAKNYKELKGLKGKSIVLYIIISSVLFILISVIGMFEINKLSNPTDYVFICIFIGFITLIASLIYANKFFKTMLKEIIIPHLLPVLGNIKWEKTNDRILAFSTGRPCSSAMGRKFENSGLFLKFKEYATDDEISGKYNGVDFNIIETQMRIGEINFINFRGVVLTYNFNKKINCPTIVSSRCANLNKNGLKAVLIISLILLAILYMPGLFFINSLDSLQYIFNPIVFLIAIICIIKLLIDNNFIKYLSFSNNYPDKVIMENSKFNKKFNVYSSDQVEARYFVTPLFMEKFYNLKTAFGAKNIRCSFFDDNLMIAIETGRDLFELGSLFVPLQNYKTIEKFYDEINAIFEMIDYFKLNEDIYLK